MPYKQWERALSASRECDLMIVAGSSLEVMPIANLPLQALDRGAHLIIINQTTTYLGVRADVLLLEDVATVLPKISEKVIETDKKTK